MSHRILIVEDDIDIARNLKMILNDEGFEVDAAENGQVALNRLKSSAVLPCLILLDLMMPTMDGFQFRKEQILLPELANIPVIIMTADSQIESKKSQVNVEAIIAKPLNIDHLIGLIQKFC